MARRTALWLAGVLTSIGFSGTAHAVQVYVVDRTDDTTVQTCSAAPSDCTLRGALFAAGSGDTITFDSTVFPPAVPGIIYVQTPLPALLVGTLTIQGTFGSGPGVILDGTTAGLGTSGLVIQSASNYVRGLTIRNFDGDGIFIDDAPGNYVGGPLSCTDSLRNVLIGNGGYGLHIAGELADGNQISVNWIGTADGSTAVGNGTGGVLIEGGADSNTLGAGCYEIRVYGNLGNGIDVVDPGTTGNYVANGKIGIPSLGNLGHGIFIDGATGFSTNYPVRVEGNGGDGLHVLSGSGRIISDSGYGAIAGNGGLAVNLVGGSDPPSGVTPNDAGDADVGPNGLLNFPVITSVTGSGPGTVLVSGTACGSCTVRVYRADGDPSGYGEAASHMATVTANGAGNWSVSASLGPGQQVTAAAFDGAGNMSELAQNVAGPLERVVDRTDDTLVSACTAAPNDCTLRGALTVAAGGDTVTFSSTVFPPASPATIAVTSPLPPLATGGVVLKGTFGSGPGVILDGVGAGSGVSGLVITSNGNYVQALRIRRFAGDGIAVIGGSGNAIGGPTSCTDGFRNVLTENGGYGLHISGESADNNQISVNWIGTNDGSTAAGNLTGGVRIDQGADSNTLGAGCYEIRVYGNQGNGIDLIDAGTTGNYIANGKIGIPALGNSGHGIYVDGASGFSTNYPVRVEGNGGDGLRVVSGTGNRVISDSGYGAIAGNGGLAVNLVGLSDPPDGVTPNDAGDADAGPNDLLNFPVISSVVGAGSGSVTVTGSACNSCTVRIYRVAADPSGHGEAAAHLATVTASSLGAFATTVSLGPGEQVTAAAFNAGGSMSELAANVAGPQQLVVDRTDDAAITACTAAPNDCTLRGALLVAASTDTIAFDSTVFNPGAPGIIYVTSALPPVSQGTLTIQGTFSGYSGVIIDGSLAGIGTDGLTITSGGNFIRALRIRNFGGDGLEIDDAANNVIGSPTTCTDFQRNTFTGNARFGIHITGEGADGNQLTVNWVGTLDGSTAAANLGGGVRIDDGADNNTLGAGCYEMRVYGNIGNGVEVVDVGTTGNYIANGRIGIPSLGNTGNGIYVDGATGFNTNYPVRVEGNGLDGVHVVSGSGIRVTSDSGYGAIAGNGGLGINLVAAGDPVSGVTANDPGDADAGANGLLNFPVITNITGAGGGNYLVRGYACAACSVRVYLADNDPSGYGEGSAHKGTGSADGFGIWSITVTLGIPSATTALTTTATNAAGSMSEFSQNANVLGFVAIGAVCGNGVVEGGEQCDDANTLSGDGCNGVCVLEVCGDGIVQPALGETCEGSCSDGNACTADVCLGCVCVSTAVTCNDATPCTTDGCSPATGCTFVNNTSPCSDGNACTTGDACGGGSCQGGSALVCNDGNGCTNDSCSPATGCVYAPNSNACSDNNACTSNDYCAFGFCQPGPSVSCNDSNPCTNDLCSFTLGCVYQNNTQPCNDGNACTVGDACGGGSCQGGSALSCNDGNGCTTDGCSPITGCTHSNNSDPCSDNNACTSSDYCAFGGCQPGPSVSCNDSNPCTDDLCSISTGCQYQNNTAPCSDGSACTTGDACSGGSCQGGPALVCNDSNPCTTDACSPATGCAYTNNTAPCSDGNACTSGDACSGGSCAPGAPLSCNDANVCTTDSCSPTTGCQHAGVSPCCGDASCSFGEGCATCPADCGACSSGCGNAVCGPGENCISCPTDCGACAPTCGTGGCGSGETCLNCPLDCGPCPPVCGNAVCSPGETCSSCPADCGACAPGCGNHVCGGSETCASCSADCGPCAGGCGDGLCAPGENCISCASDCGPCAPTCGSGGCTPGEHCVNCPLDCGQCPPVCADGTCVATEDCASCPADCGACVAGCGNGNCTGPETCTSCTADCGTCPAACGDGYCHPGESCTSCPGDCGPCAPACPDAACGPMEQCVSCPQDCGSCPASCGDGYCQAGVETCGTCPADCGACRPGCNNHNCSGGETCATCPDDCGFCP